MSKPLYFLKKEQVLFLHKFSIDRYGGSHGIRDEGLLDSALEMPRSGFGNEYFHKSVFDKASAYLFHLIKNHPFIDGNKRIALACAETFLDLNGYILSDKYQDELYNFVIKVASENIPKEVISSTLENMCK